MTIFQKFLTLNIDVCVSVMPALRSKDPSIFLTRLYSESNVYSSLSQIHDFLQQLSTKELMLTETLTRDLEASG